MCEFFYFHIMNYLEYKALYKYKLSVPSLIHNAFDSVAKVFITYLLLTHHILQRFGPRPPGFTSGALPAMVWVIRPVNLYFVR